MKKHSLLGALLLCGLSAFAQDKKAQDTKAIESMCGCYEVTFNFAETFQLSTDPAYEPSKKKTETALEWVELVEKTPNKIMLQHLLIVGPDMIVKHWRQDWEFQPNQLMTYQNKNCWTTKKVAANETKGQWAQNVYQVDDSPRYAGSATWVHVDGRSFWTSIADAPLPRREHTMRFDYNVLQRTNTHEITKEGWIHDQDNVKIQRDENGKDTALAHEKGMDVYRKVDDARCQAAQKYWKQNAELWKYVREKWAKIYAENPNLRLKDKVEGKTIYSHLFEMEGKSVDKKAIDKILESFVVKA